MKKIMQWVFVATLICGASLFTSCSNDNVTDLKEKIIGKWMSIEIDGKSVLTDNKSIYTIVSTSEGRLLVSALSNQSEETEWDEQVEMMVSIKGKKMTLTYYLGESTKVVEVFKFTVIDDNMFTANHKITVTENGEETLSNEGEIHFVKVTDDFSQDLLGTWECLGITGDQTHNDDNARLEFLSDGSYKYYRQNDADEWELVTNREISEYFVEGNYLATRWQEPGEPMEYEYWEIDKIDGNYMKWSGLRQLENGARFRQGVTWEKVE